MPRDRESPEFYSQVQLRHGCMDLLKNDFGWYYCENSSENFSAACSDGLDNDGDGLIDCQDQITFPRKALIALNGGNFKNIQCRAEVPWDNPNCRENTSDDPTPASTTDWIIK